MDALFDEKSVANRTIQNIRRNPPLQSCRDMLYTYFMFNFRRFMSPCGVSALVKVSRGYECPDTFTSRRVTPLTSAAIHPIYRYFASSLVTSTLQNAPGSQTSLFLSPILWSRVSKVSEKDTPECPLDLGPTVVSIEALAQRSV